MPIQASQFLHAFAYMLGHVECRYWHQLVYLLACSQVFKSSNDMSGAMGDCDVVDFAGRRSFALPGMVQQSSGGATIQNRSAIFWQQKDFQQASGVGHCVPVQDWLSKCPSSSLTKGYCIYIYIHSYIYNYSIYIYMYIYALRTRCTSARKVLKFSTVRQRALVLRSHGNHQGRDLAPAHHKKRLVYV